MWLILRPTFCFRFRVIPFKCVWEREENIRTPPPQCRSYFNFSGTPHPPYFKFSQTSCSLFWYQFYVDTPSPLPKPRPISISYFSCPHTHYGIALRVCRCPIPLTDLMDHSFQSWSCNLKGVVSKNLQKPYICRRGGYNSLSDGAYHVDTLGPTKLQGHRIMFWIHPFSGRDLTWYHKTHHCKKMNEFRTLSHGANP